MNTPDLQGSAQLILKLYELRREPELRLARQWFLREFRPQSAQQILDLNLSGERASAEYRMVTSYWDMACALVHKGAIDTAMFCDANTEHVALFSLMEPHLAELRKLIGEPDYLANWERLVLETAGAAQRLESRRQLFAAWTRKA